MIQIDPDISKNLVERAVEYGWVIAEYRPAKLQEHQGHPLVEALTPYAEDASVLAELTSWPECRPEERDESKGYRLSALARIRTLLQPMPWHKTVLDLIYRLIWTGYSFRNPLDRRRRKVNDNYRQVQQSGTLKPLMPMEPTHASMSAMLGGSGIGKSMIVRRILSCLPQVIVHPQYGYVQLVWLYVDCPPNGSVNDLLQWIIEAADAILVGGYVEESRQRGGTYAVRLSVVKKILIRHHVGLLVIDEIQNCLEKKVGKSHEQFFTSFPNMHRTPVFHIGLPSVLEAYPVATHPARRICDDGVYTLPPKMSDDEWALFAEELLRYQWTLEVTDASEIEPVLKWESAAIPSIAARIFQLAQAIAITTDKPKITPELIKEVVQKHLVPLLPILNLIRAGEEHGLKNYDSIMKDTTSAIDKIVDDATSQYSELREKADKRRTSDAIRNAVGSLLSIGYPENQAYAMVSRFAKEQPGCDAAWLVMRCLREKDRQANSLADLEKRVAEEANRGNKVLNGGSE